jgi:hypothetical protein
MEAFSLSSNILKEILEHAKPMGHNEKPHNLNLGFGFLYYGVVRAIRPKHALVIGSGYGFSVVCLALGIKDNGCGQLSFVDPSYSIFKDGPFKSPGGRGTWDEPSAAGEHFRRFAVEDLVTHHKMTSEEFFASYNSLGLPPIDLAFIDGSHTYQDVRHDFIQVVANCRRNSYVFLHDTNIYVRELLRHSGVKRWIRMLKKEEKCFEVVNFPFSSGVALVRIVEPCSWDNVH